MDSERVVIRNGFPTKGTIEHFADKVKWGNWMFISPYGKSRASLFFTDESMGKAMNLVDELADNGILSAINDGDGGYYMEFKAI